MPKPAVLVLFDIDGTLIVCDRFASQYKTRWLGSSRLWRLTMQIVKTMAKICDVEVKLGILTSRLQPHTVLRTLTMQLRADNSQLRQGFVAYGHCMKMLYDSLAKPLQGEVVANAPQAATSAGAAASGSGGSGAVELAHSETHEDETSSLHNPLLWLFAAGTPKGEWLFQYRRQDSHLKAESFQSDFEISFAEAKQVLPDSVLPDISFYQAVRNPASIASYDPSNIIVLDDNPAEVDSLEEIGFSPVRFEFDRFTSGRVHYSTKSIQTSLGKFFTRCYQRLNPDPADSTEALPLAEILKRLKARFGETASTTTLHTRVKAYHSELEKIQKEPDTVDGVMSYSIEPVGKIALDSYKKNRTISLQAVESVFQDEVIATSAAPRPKV